MTSDTAQTAAAEPRAAIDALVGQRAPYLIGVRHHSPAVSVVMPGLLEEAAPDVIAIELPAEAEAWLPWLTDPDVQAPVAMAFGFEGGQAFYPYADFSPELVALRWARERGVAVRCIDLPISSRGARDDEPLDDVEESTDEGPEQAEPDEGSLAASEGRSALARLARAEESDEMWDRLVEAPAPGSRAEQVRRAALALGWASRLDTPTIDAETLARERQMRAAVREELAAGRRVAAVVGAFHAPALSEDLVSAATEPAMSAGGVPGCLVGYSFADLDSRSGYPAGIRDPGWQQLVIEADGDPHAIEAAAATVLTLVTRQLRAAGHPAGPGEASETLRVACDLARLRSLPAPGRRELVEAATSVLAQGDVLGRGRAVAAALEATLIGTRRGVVARGTPVSALRAQLVEELDAVKLPTAGQRELRLAPLRGGLDLRRHVLLRRLEVGAISYARPVGGDLVRGADRVTQEWRLAWTAATDASIELASTAGLGSAQVARTKLLTRQSALRGRADLLADAADCAIPDAVARVLDELQSDVARCGFTEAVTMTSVLHAVATARIPGAVLLPGPVRERCRELLGEFDAAAVREIPGIAGSHDLSDAQHLAAYVSQATARELSLHHVLDDVETSGSPLMQGAVAGMRLDAPGQSERVGSWLEARDPATLRERLTGFVTTAGPAIATAPAATDLIDRVSQLPDATFVGLLPSLRGGFDPLPGHARDDLLEELARRFGALGTAVLSPADSAAAAAYDLAAARRLADLGLADVVFSPAERWRLILGAQPQQLSQTGGRMAAALDELYGSPHDDALDEGRRGAGRGPSRLGVREWRSEIEVLFGADAVQEVFGEAANRGRGDTLSELDPATVRPSVDLLTTALSLAGGLSEARLAQLRPLVSRLVAALTAELAIRIRPALSGLATPRPTRRRTARIDLPRTIRANLRNVVEGPKIVPADPVFRQVGNRSVDWHMIIVVDVSGSMGASVVYSALMAAILSGVPSLSVSLLAFSTEVIDFSERVSDPLQLLLEVEVGGGTDIAQAMRVARSKVRVPTRTLCAVISDFEEPGSVDPLLAEVDALARSGVNLLGCAALDDSGTACFNAGIAAQVAAAGMRVAAVSPLQLAQWVRQVVRA